MNTKRLFVRGLALATPFLLAAASARADGPCAGLPSHAALASALGAARAAANGGFNLDMWRQSSIATASSAPWRSRAAIEATSGQAAA